MKKINKFLPIMVTSVLLFTPCYVMAEEPISTPEATPTPVPTETNEPTPTPTPTPTPEATPEPTNTPIVTPEATPEIKKSISLNKSELSLDAGKTTILKATTTPDNIEVVWESSDKSIATVSNDGTITAGNKAGSATITATIKGTKYSADCIVKVSRTIGKDATLKSLNISNGKLNKSFNPDVLEYTVTIDKDTSSLIIKYELSDVNAKPFPPADSKNKNLKNGDVLTFKVVAEDGETNKTYKLNIVKDTLNLNLKSLKINGYALNEVFDKEKLEYTASIPYEIETITVQASAEDSDSKVNVSGITNLKVGENTVRITVTNGDDTREYSIVVTREKEVSVDEKPTSIITSSINGDVDNSSDNKTESNNNDSNNDNFLKYFIVSVACLILLVIGGIGIYFYIKTSPKKLKKELNTNKKDIDIESAIVEVDDKKEQNNNSNIQDIMNEKLVETREFKKEDLEELSKTENLFDDSEDV